jgi:glycosidase
MQWSPRTGVGFTSGTPYESPQPDSLTTTVEAQDADPGSLLNLYRRLIHLRMANEALAKGRLVPLVANNSSVTAYLRRTGDQAVLVVANLGASAVSGVSIGSAEAVLPPGRYEPRNLLGGPNGAVLEVSPEGRMRGYVPVPGTLDRRESLVLELIRR